jgi:hypothetical protein
MFRYILSILYLALNIVWIIYEPYGWTIIASVELIIVLGFLSAYSQCRRYTTKLRIADPNSFPNDSYWNLLTKLGVPIYYPRASEEYSLSFRMLWLMSFLTAIAMLILTRWVEAGAALANGYAAHLASVWLDPQYFMRDRAAKDPQWSDIADAIDALRQYVHGGVASEAVEDYLSDLRK